MSDPIPLDAEMLIDDLDSVAARAIEAVEEMIREAENLGVPEVGEALVQDTLASVSHDAVLESSVTTADWLTEGFSDLRGEAAPLTQMYGRGWDFRTLWAAAGLGSEDIVAKIATVVRNNVFNAQRQTVLQNFENSHGFRFARIATPSCCEFCQMLASRGAVYRTAHRAIFTGYGRRRRDAKSPPGRLFHDNCRCVVSPALEWF